jgi:hypothetical protein
MNNIEEIFKSSLENAGMPYAPSAWDAMQAKLDQHMPVKAPKPSFKWGWVASSVVVGTTALVYAVWPVASTTTARQPKTQATTEIAPQTASVNTPAEKTNVSTGTATPLAESPVNTPVSSVYTTRAAVTEYKKPAAGTDLSSKTPVPAETKTALDGIAAKIAQVTPTSNTGNTPVKVVFPKANAAYCEGEAVQLKNNHSAAFMLIGDNGYSAFLDARKTQEVTLSESGNYYFQYAESGTVKKEFAFRALAAPKADFTFEDDKLYDEKGLPATPCKAMYIADSYTWTNGSGLLLSTEREFNARFFNKGSHELTLTVRDENGCESKTAKTIVIPVEYDLMATDVLDPFSNDSKNISFMPYALLVRNVSFQLIIVDPQSGNVIYKTMDANKPWDGTDSRTGQLVPSGKSYAWKATIYNPETFERPEYKGTIIRK